MGCSTEIRLLVDKYFFELGAKSKHLVWYMGELVQETTLSFHLVSSTI